MPPSTKTLEETEDMVQPEELEALPEVVRSVLRRGVIIIQRYGQFICNDLCDRRLKTEMRSSIKDTNDGVSLVIELIPDKKFLPSAIKNEQIRRLIKRHEKRYKKINRRGRVGSHKT